MTSAVIMVCGDIGTQCIKVFTEYNIKINLIVITNKLFYGDNFHDTLVELELQNTITSKNTSRSNLQENLIWKYDPRKKDSLFNKIKEISPDYLFLVNFPHILDSNIFQIPKTASYYLHFSLLPNYNGCNPIEWSIINGEKQTGVTLGIIQKSISDLKIINQIKVPILSNDTNFEVEKKLTVAAEIILFQEMPHILNNSIISYPLNKQYGSYFGKLGIKDRQFYWYWNALRIHNLIRACSHSDCGAFFNFKEYRFSIHKSRLSKSFGKPGSYKLNDSSLIIFAGDNLGLEVDSLVYNKETLQPEKWMRMCQKDCCQREVAQ